MAVKRFRTSTTLLENKQVSLETRTSKYILDPYKRRSSTELKSVDTNGSETLTLSPGELLMHALGSCLALTARAQSENMQIQLNSFKVDVTGEVDIDATKADLANVHSGLSRIIKTYYIDADNSADEIKAFIDTVEAVCPIHATLKNPGDFQTKIIHESKADDLN